MSAERVPLAIQKHWTDHDDRPRYHHVPVKAAYPFWRSARGYMIHRIRSAIIFPGQDYRFCPTWWCGNTSHYAIPVKAGCEEGLKPCERCETAWQKAVRA